MQQSNVLNTLPCKVHPRRLARSRTGWNLLVCVGIFCVAIGSLQPVHGQSDNRIEAPSFRPREDAKSVQDLNEVREKIRRLSDSRGPINPLSDYTKRNPPAAGVKAQSNKAENSTVDEEAKKIPSLTPEAQRRLKVDPPSIPSQDLAIIGLYAPPRIVSNETRTGIDSLPDDGFRPVLSYAIPSTVNRMQIDPAATVPPVLGPPSIGTPGIGAPSIGAPTVGAPAIGAPGTNLPSIGSPGTIGSLPTYSSPIPSVPTGAVPTNVMPAPPSYVVPGPAVNPYPPPGSNNLGGIPTGPAAAPFASQPYAPATPTYSREGTPVNSLPFVSKPPVAKDARWMVSPEVYRRMEGNACGPTAGGSPYPNYGATPTGANPGSPFVYVPPVAMPVQTPVAASKHSWLHPFRHLHQ